MRIERIRDVKIVSPENVTERENDIFYFQGPKFHRQ